MATLENGKDLGPVMLAELDRLRWENHSLKVSVGLLRKTLEEIAGFPVTRSWGDFESRLNAARAVLEAVKC
jgi:hypothetical protein